MQKETKKKLSLIICSFLGGVVITLLLVWLTASPCPHRKRAGHTMTRRPGIERPVDMQGHRRAHKRGSQGHSIMEEHPVVQEAQPTPAPEQTK